MSSKNSAYFLKNIIIFFKKLYKKTSKYLDVFLRRFFMIHQDLLISTFKAELYSFIEHFIFVFCLF